MKTIVSRALLIIWLLCVTVLAQITAHAQQLPTDASLLKEMPTPDRILTEIRGTNDLDTAARQLGAFYQLKMMIADIVGMRNALPEAAAMQKSYFDAMAQVNVPKVDAQGRRLSETGSPQLAEWTHLKMYYEDDESYRKELLQRFFSANFQARYQTIKNAHAEMQTRYEGQQRVEQQQEKARWAESEFKRLAPLYTAAGTAVFLIVYFLALKFGFSGRVELDSTDSRKLRCGGTDYTLYPTTGTVLSPTKDREVRTYVSGGHNNTPVSSSTTTITHLEFFLKHANGKEEPFHVTHALAQTALRDGHKLSVVWAIKKGQSLGNYFLFRNHSTGETVYDDSELKRIASPFAAKRLPALLLSIWSCFGLLIYYVVANSVAKSRMQQAKAKISERLIPQLDK